MAEVRYLAAACQTDLGASMTNYPVFSWPGWSMVVDYDGRPLVVKTYAHDLEIGSKENVPRFLRSTRCPTYREYRHRGRRFFCVEAQALVEHTVAQGKKGRTFFYPKSLNHHQPPRSVA